MRSYRFIVLVLVLVSINCAFPGRIAADTWLADSDHSSIQFRTLHGGVVDIIGWFESFDVQVVMNDRDFKNAVVTARMLPASVRMPNSAVDSVGIDKYVVPGEMTIKGVTRTLEWNVTLQGAELVPAMPGFRATTQINRLEFGVGDSTDLPGTETPLIGLAVDVTCNIRLSYYHVEKVILR